MTKWEMTKGSGFVTHELRRGGLVAVAGAVALFPGEIRAGLFSEDDWDAGVGTAPLAEQQCASLEEAKTLAERLLWEHLAKVGAGATYQIGSDQYPCTIVAVSVTRHKVEVTFDRTVGPGLFLPQPEGRRETFTRRADGSYRLVGKNHGLLSFRGRRSYMDPSF